MLKTLEVKTVTVTNNKKSNEIELQILHYMTLNALTKCRSIIKILNI